MNKTILLVVLAMAGVMGHRLFTTPSRSVTPGSLGDRAAVISTGQAVDLAQHVQPRGYTIVEFMADW